MLSPSPLTCNIIGKNSINNQYDSLWPSAILMQSPDSFTDLMISYVSKIWYILNM